MKRVTGVLAVGIVLCAAFPACDRTTDQGDGGEPRLLDGVSESGGGADAGQTDRPGITEDSVHQPEGRIPPPPPLCQNTCPLAGLTSCDDEANGYRLCEPQPGGCLAWSPVHNCGYLATCQEGGCVPDCTDECSIEGDAFCSFGPPQGISTCGYHDDDPCLEWGDFLVCPDGTKCQDNECVPACEHECQPIGARECSGNSGYVVCGNHDGDPCLEWSGLHECDSDELCQEGDCVETCIEPDEPCEDYDDCCDYEDQAYHCCPILYICVEDWWE